MAGVFGFCWSPSLLIAILLFTGTVVPSLSNVPNADPLWGYFSAVAGQHDRSGMMGFNEFKELWNVLNQWKASFLTTDRDRSGTLEPHELHHALLNFVYTIEYRMVLGKLVKYTSKLWSFSHLEENVGDDPTAHFSVKKWEILYPIPGIYVPD